MQSCNSGAIEMVLGGKSFTSGSNATEVCLNSISGVAVASNGDVYLGDKEYGRILVRRKSDKKLYLLMDGLGQVFGIDVAGSRLVVAETGSKPCVSEINLLDQHKRILLGTPTPSQASRSLRLHERQLSTEVSLAFPFDVVLEESRYLWTTDVHSRKVYRTDINEGWTEVVSAYELGGAFDPTGVAIAGEFAYIADRRLGRVLRLHIPSRKIIEWIGPLSRGRTYKLALPTGIRCDGLGNIFIVDAGLHQILKINIHNKNVVTICGTGFRGFSGDDGLAICSGSA